MRSFRLYTGSHLLKLVYETVDEGSMFQADKLTSVCRHEENLIRKHDSFAKTCVTQRTVAAGNMCCPSWSLGYVVALMSNKSSCFDVAEMDVTYAQEILTQFQAISRSVIVPSDLTNCQHFPEQCTVEDLIYITSNFLLPISYSDHPTFTMSFSPIVLCPDSNNCGNSTQQLFEDNFGDDASLDDDVTKVTAGDFGLKFVLFDLFLVSDFFLVMMGALSALCIIWIYTHSLFITLCAITNMAMSLTMAYSIYFLVFRLTFFPFVNVISAVLIIGVGADDTFVYIDLWRASQKKFGFTKEKRVHVLEETSKHAFSTMFVTSFTTSSALFATAFSNITAIKCFAAYAGLAILINFAYTITWLPAVIVIHDKYVSIINPMVSALQTKSHIVNSLLKVINKCCHSPNLFFEVILPKVIWHLRFFWLIFLLSVGALGFVLSFIYPRLGLPEKNEFQLFRDDHLFEQYDQVYRKTYAFDINEKPLMPVFFIWGVIPIDNGNHWDPYNTGQLVLDTNFEFGNSQTQEWLYNFCIRRHLGYDLMKNNTLKVLYLAFDGSTPYSLQFSSVDTFWKELRTWTQKEVINAPVGMQGGWSVSQMDIQLYFYDLQAGIASGTATSVSISLSMASIVLFLSTRNIVTTLFAIITISCAVFVVIGCLVLLGWELNVFESAILSLAVGLSVDFTIHYGVAFRLAPFPDRKSKAMYATTTLSAAITVAAVSTFTAGAFMIPATVLSYVQLGVFLTLVMAVSWIYANFLFLPLCFILGPNNNFGQVRPVSFFLRREDPQHHNRCSGNDVLVRSNTSEVSRNVDRTD
ncbi:hypothetical protein BSL78_26210 [Apostichopus japonicus]|uniref:SSD domain-containing protein n=1 Tax=Stichopus japonicus TaxID=307972 RepID=A0A2G8JMJ5_STIJA|nr:hypothetical protein BSL78_26210 [Apostichopus japonicus]